MIRVPLVFPNPAVFGAGSFHFVQLITPSNTFTIGGFIGQQSKVFGKQGLDGDDPYPWGGGPPVAANGMPTPTPFDPNTDAWATDDGVKYSNDGPGFQPVSDHLIAIPPGAPQDGGWEDVAGAISRANLRESFKTYLMYRPPGGTLSAWVPLLLLNWSFEVSGMRKLIPPPINGGGFFNAGPANNPWTFLGGQAAIPAAFQRAASEPVWTTDITPADLG